MPDIKDNPYQLAIARLAGLDIAIDEFADDLALAAEAADKARSALPPIDDPHAQPWPPVPMRRTK